MSKKLISAAILMATLSLLVSACVSSTGNQNNDENSTLEVIMNRKSVRDYHPDRPIKEADIQKLLKAGMAAPSGRDIRPWEFIVVTDKQILEGMAGELPTARMLAKAPAAIIVCGDSIQSFYWYLDCAAATQNILLAAESLGLGAVWTASYPYEDRMAVVTKYTGLPEHILPLAVIPIGYPVGKQSSKDKFNEQKIHYNQW